MNLFILSLDPAKTAEYMMDKHIAKIILKPSRCYVRHSVCLRARARARAYATRASTKSPTRTTPSPFGAAQHKPTSSGHWTSLTQCTAEWKYRYGHPAHKQHKSYIVAQYLRQNIPPASAFERVGVPGIMTPFALAMPDEFKVRRVRSSDATPATGTSHGHDIYDAVASYRSYYLSEPKRRIAKWGKLRGMPLWYARGLRKLQGRPAPRLVVVKHLKSV